MKAVILAAGKSSRFKPFTSLSHKSAFPIMGKMLIEHTIESIKKSGITEIVIVVSPDSPLQKQLGNGKNLGVSIEYAEQKVSRGMGDALLSAKHLLSDSFFLLNANHVDFHEFKEEMEKKNPHGVTLLLRAAEHIHMYGVVQVENGKITDISEKPEKTSGDAFRLIGMYLLNQDFLSQLAKTPEEEYQFETALAEYVRNSDTSYIVTEKEAVSLKYAWNLLAIKNYLLKSLEHSISPKAEIKDGVTMQGTVYIEDGARIYEGVILKGPIYIGKNAIVGNYSMLREGVVLEEGAKIGSYTEIKNSLVGKGSSFDYGMVLDSILADDVKIGARVTTANVRLDRNSVIFTYGDKKIDTGLRSLGAMIGKGARLGVAVVIMPAVMIGENSIIGPATTVMKHVDANTTYYAKPTLEIHENS